VAYKGVFEDNDSSGRVFIFKIGKGRNVEDIRAAIKRLAENYGDTTFVGYKAESGVVWVDFRTRDQAERFTELDDLILEDDISVETKLTKWRSPSTPDELFISTSAGIMFESLKSEVEAQFGLMLYWQPDPENKAVFFNFHEKKFNDEACGTSLKLPFSDARGLIEIEIAPVQQFNTYVKNVKGKKTAPPTSEPSKKKEDKSFRVFEKVALGFEQRMASLESDMQARDQKACLERLIDMKANRAVERLRDDKMDSIALLMKNWRMLKNNLENLDVPFGLPLPRMLLNILKALCSLCKKE